MGCGSSQPVAVEEETATTRRKTTLMNDVPPTTHVVDPISTTTTTAASGSSNHPTTTSSNSNQKNGATSPAAVSVTTAISPTTATTANNTTANNIATTTNNNTTTDPLPVLKNKKIPTGRKAAASPNHPKVTKPKKGKGGALIPPPQPPPITTRIRADTWETTLTDDLGLDHHHHQNEEEDPEEPPHILPNQNNHSNHDHDATTTNPTLPIFDPDIDPDEKEHFQAHGGTTHNNQKKHPSQPRLAHTTNTTSSSSLGPVQEQWRTLWETQSSALVDPADVTAVVAHLRDQWMSQNQVVPVTLLGRKVRTVIRIYLPPSSSSSKSHNGNNNNNGATLANGQNSTSKMVAKVFSSGSSHNNNNNNNNSSHHHSNHHHPYHTPAMYQEARNILDKYQLLNKTLLVHILPPTPVTESIIILLRALDINPITSILLERTVTAATSAAECMASIIPMDVNQKFQKNHRTTKIPKPSQIPVFLDETPALDLPVGASFSSLAALMALATSSSSSRNQKLQLLFYIAMDPVVLEKFLLCHPAGGIPLWLLEVDQNTVISLPSLTHYHYYGNAFLPCPTKTKSTTTTATPALFVPSKSRTPLVVDAHYVQKLIRAALQQAASTTTALDTTATTPITTVPSGVAAASPPPPASSTRFVAPLSAFGRRSVSLPDATTAAAAAAAASAADQVDATNSHNGNHPNGPSAPTSSSKKPRYLMNKLSNIAEGIEIDTYSPIKTEIEDALQHYDYVNNEYLQQYDVSEWTLQEYKHWCDVVLTDFVTQIVMHHSFGAGIIPSPMVECELVTQQWVEWEKQQLRQQQEYRDKLGKKSVDQDGQSIGKLLTESVASFITGQPSTQAQNGEVMAKVNRPRLGAVFGGIGGMDGLGGIGKGIMYCLPTKWWNAWADYVGWTYDDEALSKNRSEKATRPPSLVTETLLENDPDKVIRGIMGSYEIMRQELNCGVDYVLVPPGVWDILYELYSGGPPLPRMVKPKETSSSFISFISDTISNQSMTKPNSMEELDYVVGNMVAPRRVTRLSSTLMVETHPWILHVHLCDPLQPYRRGDTGPISIRVMVSPTQPLWRVLSEIVCRFTFQTYRAFDTDMRGRIRLWKKIETKDTPLPRYGPWNLLCKSRYAILPSITHGVEYDGNFDELIDNWKQYTDDATVENIGLQDQNNLMVEFAVIHRNGGLAWPREAAAEAGKVRRLADEDKQFRQTLLGIDDMGKALPNPPSLVDMGVDAMEFSGKWYTVKILEVQRVETVADEDDEAGIDADDCDTPKRVIRKRVKVNFQNHGGHFDWIDVDSDRLQTPGRFASEANLQSPESPTSGNGNGTTVDGRSKSGALAKRSNSTTESVVENTKSCPLPGYGACGLSNLGNSCYMNSAVQCMSYLPLLRSYLLGDLYKTNGDLNRDNPLGTGGKLLEEFAELLRSMWSAKLGEKSPTRFRLHLGKSNEQFACADQQDAQEFLNYMIDVLHEDSNRVRKKPYVESLADGWVEQTLLSRVGEESWRRFLRRNQSIMADVAMGQALNTVTCPVCNYSSRNFDPFNLLSIPIPTVADAVFQCTVVRRSTARNCPWILNRPKKGHNRATRYPDKKNSSKPPSEACTTEQYVIALSRLADGGDLRLQIQNLSGIRADHLRLCRAESVAVNNKSEEGAVTNRYIKIVPLTEKEGPASQLLKMRAPNDVSPRMPTQIIAFEMSLRLRQLKLNGALDADADVVVDKDNVAPKAEKAQIERYLAAYGDEKECRLVDTDPTVLAKAMSRSLWPRSDSEFKIGLRVDAKDHRNNWFVGSIVDIIDEEISGGDSDTGQEVAIQHKKVRIHFDNYLPKWDETYTIEHFKKGRVHPLYTFAEPKPKPTEFVVHHRYSERSNNHSYFFGQSFYVQCPTEWSNARAGAHIIAQASRFLRHKSNEKDVIRLVDRVHASVSELIDCLVECDREYVKRALGVSEHCTDEEKKTAYRNPTFDASSFIAEADQKVAALLQNFPFELRLCSMEPPTSTNGTGSNEESAFPLAFHVTVGNFVSTRHALIIHWREPTGEKKKSLIPKIGLPAILYVDPHVDLHESCAAMPRDDQNDNNENGDATNRNPSGTTKMDRSEMDLDYCLTEFCKVQKLPLSDSWKCPRCRVIREGGQNMNLWRLPDLLTFHMKRFNMSARWHEKITTKVHFPMTGLDMSQWCHPDSPVLQDGTKDSCMYDLIGVMNHYGSLTGGHYVATCRATACGRDGRDEVAYPFHGAGVGPNEGESTGGPNGDDWSSTTTTTATTATTSGWSLGRPKPKINQSRLDAVLQAQALADSSEPMWLQFDDEIVEAIPPRLIVSEMAYVLFYRKRRITPSNIAKYSTLE